MGAYQQTTRAPSVYQLLRHEVAVGLPHLAVK